MRILIQGLSRSLVDTVYTSGDHVRVGITPISEPLAPEGSLEVEALVRNVRSSMQRAASLGKNISPEVLAIRNAMDASGVGFAIDVHGDEAIPAVFLAGFEGIPSITSEQLAGYQRYRAILDRRSPDFQTRLGYPVAPAGKANLSMATSQLAERFGCVAMTLEMPFKDNDELPDPVEGWSPQRSRILARDCLAALAEWLEG